MNCHLHLYFSKISFYSSSTNFSLCIGKKLREATWTTAAWDNLLMDKSPSIMLSIIFVLEGSSLLGLSWFFLVASILWVAFIFEVGVIFKFFLVFKVLFLFRSVLQNLTLLLCQGKISLSRENCLDKCFKISAISPVEILIFTNQRGETWKCPPFDQSEAIEVTIKKETKRSFLYDHSCAVTHPSSTCPMPITPSRHMERRLN